MVYEKPVMEVLRLEETDIIRASGVTSGVTPGGTPSDGHWRPGDFGGG